MTVPSVAGMWRTGHVGMNSAFLDSWSLPD